MIKIKINEVKLVTPGLVGQRFGAVQETCGKSQVRVLATP